MKIRIPKQNKTYLFIFSIVELTRNNNNKKRGQKYMEVGHTRDWDELEQNLFVIKKINTKENDNKFKKLLWNIIL